MRKVILALLILFLTAPAGADVLTLYGHRRSEGILTGLDRDGISFADSKGGEKRYKIIQIEKLQVESKTATVRLKGKQKDITGDVVGIEHGMLTLRSSGSYQRIFIQNIEDIKLGDKVVIVSNNGEEVDIGSLLEPGKVTIVDFFAEWCGPCLALAPKLEELAASDHDIVLRKINIVDWDRPICKQYSLTSIPNVRVFDRNRKQVGEPTPSYQEIVKLVDQAKK